MMVMVVVTRGEVKGLTFASNLDCSHYECFFEILLMILDSPS